MSFVEDDLARYYDAPLPAWLFIPAQLRLRPGDSINGSINGIDVADVQAETDLNAYNLGIRGLRPLDPSQTWAAGQYMRVNGLYFFWRGPGETNRWHEGISTGVNGLAPRNKAFVRPGEVYPADPSVGMAGDIGFNGYVVQTHRNYAAAEQITVGAVVAHYVAGTLSDRAAGVWLDGAAPAAGTQTTPTPTYESESTMSDTPTETEPVEPDADEPVTEPEDAPADE